MSARNSVVSLVSGSMRRSSCIPERFTSTANKRDSVIETRLANDLKPMDNRHELMTLSEYSNETDRTPQPPMDNQKLSVSWNMCFYLINFMFSQSSRWLLQQQPMFQKTKLFLIYLQIIQCPTIRQKLKLQLRRSQKTTERLMKVFLQLVV